MQRRHMDQREATWAPEKYMESLGGAKLFFSERGKESLLIHLSGPHITNDHLATLIDLLECQHR
jgi:hypothetical protein